MPLWTMTALCFFLLSQWSDHFLSPSPLFIGSGLPVAIEFSPLAHALAWRVPASTNLH